MKRFILITSVVATALFVWFILFMASDDASVGALGFVVFIVSFFANNGINKCNPVCNFSCIKV